MKKSNFLALALALGLAAPASAQDVGVVNDFFDFTNINTDMKLLQVFYDADQQGRTVPTEAELEAAGFPYADLAFFRSHVAKRPILSRADRILPSTYETRNFWFNMPMGEGKGPAIGQPSKTFISEAYSMWNYTTLHGAWNRSFFQTPSVWTDAAHKNGTDMFSGIKFFESWNTGDGAWTDVCSQKNADGTFKWVKPVINLLMYFGMDGINFNWEDSSYQNANVMAFHHALQAEAKARGFDNFHIGIYTGVSGVSAGTNTAAALIGNATEGKICDLMLNYQGNNIASPSSLGSTASAAEQILGNTESVYAGIYTAAMSRSWQFLDGNTQAHKVGLCIWGEHAFNNFWRNNAGDDAYSNQSNYQELLERGFSGGYRNPLHRPAVSTNVSWDKNGDTPQLGTFAGYAEWIPERSAIQGNLPFMTGFNLGNGDRYTYKGKKTTGAWYNMGTQDLVPTYRWLVVEPGTLTYADNIQPEFSYKDSYTGGSCLQLTGTPKAAGTDIVLYKTSLNVSAGSAYANIAMKTGVEGSNASNLYLIVRKADGTWLEFPCGNVEGKTWQEKRIELSSLAQGDVIERVGLRVKGSADNYKLLVGKLELNDAVVTPVASVKDVNVEVREEYKDQLSAKLTWKVDQAAAKRADWDMLFNDEANIDHFEVVYKNGADGRVSEVSRTTSWSTIVGDIRFESADDQPYLGVRAVSTDLKTYSPIAWVEVPRGDQASLPERVEEDPYGITQMSPTCDGATQARQTRYVTSVVTTGATQNLNYSANAPVADGTQYANCLDHKLIVNQGQHVVLTFKVFQGSDDLHYCNFAAWMDLDGSKTFNPDLIADGGELIAKFGDLRTGNDKTPIYYNGCSVNIDVPEDAHVGQSRLRIVFTDAWFAGQLVPVGYNNKGFSMDFDVEIQGTNPGREPEPDTHDEGVADEPDNMDGGTGITNVGTVASTYTVNNGQINFQNVEKAWIYAADGTLVKFLTNPASFDFNTVSGGVYLVKMHNQGVTRSVKITK